MCLTVRVMESQNCKCLIFNLLKEFQEFECFIWLDESWIRIGFSGSHDPNIPIFVCRMGTIPDRCAYWGCALLIQASTTPVAQSTKQCSARHPIDFVEFRTAIQMPVAIPAIVAFHSYHHISSYHIIAHSIFEPNFCAYAANHGPTLP